MGASIISAMHNARVVVLVFRQRQRVQASAVEVERAINIGIPVIPFRIEDIEPRGSLELFLGAAHWLDAFTKPVEQHRPPRRCRAAGDRAQYGEADADHPPREKEEPEHRAAADEERRKAAAAREEEREQARAVTEQARAELASVPPPAKTGLLAASVLAAMLALGGGWYAFAPKPIVEPSKLSSTRRCRPGRFRRWRRFSPNIRPAPCRTPRGASGKG